MRTPTEWTDEIVARLGTVPDSAIAAELGVAMTTVGRKRRELGIAAWRKPHQPLEGVTEKACVRCGQVYPLDVYLRAPGTRDGLTGSCRWCLRADWKRKRAKGRYERKGTKFGWPVKQEGASIPAPGEEGEAKPGASRLRVSAAERESVFTRAVVSRIGKEPDAVIARDLDIPVSWVVKKRLTLGLRTFRERRPAWTEENEELVRRTIERETLVRRSSQGSKLGVAKLDPERRPGVWPPQAKRRR